MLLSICREERIGGPLSVNNPKITAVTEDGYNFYIVETGGEKIIIGGLPNQSESYNAAVKDADALVLLTSKPEFNCGTETALELNPDIKIYASPAGLRNIKEIVNCEINEHIIKDGLEVNGIRFFAMPNLPWVDTVMAAVGDSLFSGEMFSGYAMAEYFRENLSVHKIFVLSAIKRLKNENISCIYPAYGIMYNEENSDIKSIFSQYADLASPTKKDRKSVAVIYSSKYGFTKALAERVINTAAEKAEVLAADVSNGCDESVCELINKADALIVGTNTINRNAPQGIWKAITNIDLINKRQMPYFVFGSFGWAGDGIKLADKTLSAMGMKQIAKPVEVLFKPKAEDFSKIENTVKKVLDFIDEM